MPQVPVQNNIGVLPQPVEFPRLTPDDFGADTFRDLGKAGNALAGIGDEITAQQQAKAQAQAQEEAQAAKQASDTPPSKPNIDPGFDGPKGLVYTHLSLANARAAYVGFHTGVNQLLNDNIYSLSPGEMANNGLQNYMEGANALLDQTKESLKDDPDAQQILAGQLKSELPSITQQVMAHHASALDQYNTQQMHAQMGLAAQKFANEDDPDIAAQHLKEVHLLARGAVGSELGADSKNPLGPDQLATAVNKTVVAPAVADAITQRAQSGDLDGALSLAQNKGDFLHPDVRDQIVGNLQQAKTTQAVSAYLNSAAHPDQVRQMADALGNPAERAVARQLAPGIASAKQHELDLHNAAAMSQQMQKVQANPSTYNPSDPLLSDEQKEVLATYRNKLLNDTIRTHPVGTTTWDNLRFMAVDDPDLFSKINPTAPELANALTGEQYGHFIKIQNEIRTGKFKEEPTPGQMVLQRLLHADSDLSIPSGETPEGKPLYSITLEGHKRLAAVFDRLSLLSPDDRDNPTVIRKVWTQLS